MSERPLSPAEVAERYGISAESVYKLLHQGAFGAKGSGYRVLNPAARHPRYRITAAGLEHYERLTAA